MNSGGYAYYDCLLLANISDRFLKLLIVNKHFRLILEIAYC